MSRKRREKEIKKCFTVSDLLIITATTTKHSAYEKTTLCLIEGGMYGKKGSRILILRDFIM